MTDDSEDGRAEPLVVFAAGSLRPAFERGPADGAPWPGGPVVFRYANARDLALAIEQGERADVFASASPTDPERLHAAGILDEPSAFARNEVVIGVAHDRSGSIRGLDDLAAPGVRLVIEIPGVPLGEYTREALRRLGRRELVDRILANVVHEEADVQAVTARLTDGAADAGFLYRTDVIAAGDRLGAIELPTIARVEATYVVGVVRGSRGEARARSWVAWLAGPAGRATLEAVGFAAPASVRT